MLRRVQYLMFMVMLLSVGLLPTYAQEALVPDKPIEGEITDEEYAQEYRFQGEAGQIVVLEMTPKEFPGDLDMPSLILRDSVGNELARYNSYGRTLLFWELPKNGTYTVIATRTDDENGLSVGEYTLLLRFPVTIELNETIENTIINDHVDYYMVRSTEDFALSITRDGDFSPEFSINEINTEFVPGTLNSVASIGGRYATQGLVGVIPGGVAYLVRVGRGTLDFQFGDVTADYTLVLKRAE